MGGPADICATLDLLRDLGYQINDYDEVKTSTLSLIHQLAVRVKALEDKNA